MPGETLRYSTGVPIPVEPDNPLTTLIRRLEAATSRLEDIASTSQSPDQQQVAGQNVDMGAASLAQGPQGGVSKGGTREGSAATIVKESLPPAIEEMDALIDGDVKAFVEASEGLDSLVEQQVGLDRCQKQDERDGRVDKNHRLQWLQKHSRTSDDFWSRRPGRRSRIHSRRLSWICSRTYNKTWAAWATSGIAIEHHR